MERHQPLLQILQDQAARIDERDDAAMELGQFDHIDVETVLIAVASDENESGLVASSAGESLGEIWARRRRIPVDVLTKLRPDARREAINTLTAIAPVLLQTT